MKQPSILLTFCLFACNPAVWAIPSAITYQGTLRDKGAPAQGTKNMTFQLTDQSGNTPYSVVIPKSIQVTNGLFSTELTFQLLTPHTWESINPYLKVTVENQTLLPTERLNATAYSLVSNAVVDGAITPAKVSPGYGLIPSGLIAMFDTACPAGWARFSALDNRFPRGDGVYGATGGNTEHRHAIGNDGNHNHGTPILGTASFHGVPLWNASPYGSRPINGTVDLHSFAVKNPGVTYDRALQTSEDGTHNHGGLTENQSSLPPYLSVVYCKKQ